ncbi:MAG: OmpH family outer membrane protein [Flavobacteriia bacterium]|nr:OmpH family outer membrane protein [Flavobacteriia bacterium]
MKTIKKVFAVVAFTLAAIPTMAQMNIGHCNSDSILVKMPEYQTAMAELEQWSTDLQSIIDDERTAIESKQQNLEANRGNWTQLRIAAAEQTIQSDARNLQLRVQEAQRTLANKERELLTPVLNQLQDAINQVGEANGYDYILDTTPGRGVVLYRDPEHDISNLVMTHMGLQ